MNDIRKIINLLEGKEEDCIAAKRGPISIVQYKDGSTDTAETDDVTDRLEQCHEEEFVEHHHEEPIFHPSKCDENVETAKHYCNITVDELRELAPILENCDDVEAWVLGELAKMSAIAEKVYHYMMNEHYKKYNQDDADTTDGKELLIDMDDDWPVTENTVSFNPKKYQDEGMFRKALRRFKGRLEREQNGNEKLFYVGDKLAAIWDTVKKAGIVYEAVDLEEAPYTDDFKGSPKSKMGQKIQSRKTGYKSLNKKTGDYSTTQIKEDE